MTSPFPTPPTSLNLEQQARIEALTAARNLLRSSEGMLKSPAPLLEDLVHLAHFVLTGVVDPGVFLPEHPDQMSPNLQTGPSASADPWAGTRVQRGPGLGTPGHDRRTDDTDEEGQG